MDFIPFNANNSDFVKKENVQSFFKSSDMCQNYMTETIGEKFRLYSYYSNGWKNESGLKTKYLLNLDKMPKNHQEAAELWRSLEY